MRLYLDRRRQEFLCPPRRVRSEIPHETDGRLSFAGIRYSFPSLITRCTVYTASRSIFYFVYLELQNTALRIKLDQQPSLSNFLSTCFLYFANNVDILPDTAVVSASIG
jgi:hypothetical protein